MIDEHASKTASTEPKINATRSLHPGKAWYGWLKQILAPLASITVWIAAPRIPIILPTDPTGTRSFMNDSALISSPKQQAEN